MGRSPKNDIETFFSHQVTCDCAVCLRVSDELAETFGIEK